MKKNIRLILIIALIFVSCNAENKEQPSVEPEQNVCDLTFYNWPKPDLQADVDFFPDANAFVSFLDTMGKRKIKTDSILEPLYAIITHGKKRYNIAQYTWSSGSGYPPHLSGYILDSAELHNLNHIDKFLRESLLRSSLFNPKIRAWYGSRQLNGFKFVINRLGKMSDYTYAMNFLDSVAQRNMRLLLSKYPCDSVQASDYIKKHCIVMFDLQ